MARGFVYLVAVLDWFSRKVLAWQLSTTLETGPCTEALKDAMRRHGKPEIMNTDQGSQFTSIEFIETLKGADIQISMDGKGAWRDNVFPSHRLHCKRLPGSGRTALADDQIRRGLPARLRQRVSRPGKPAPVSEVLQHAQTTFIAGRADARSGISQTVGTNPGGGITERGIHLQNGSKLFK